LAEKSPPKKLRAPAGKKMHLNVRLNSNMGDQSMTRNGQVNNTGRTKGRFQTNRKRNATGIKKETKWSRKIKTPV